MGFPRFQSAHRWCRYDATQFGAGHLPPFDQLLCLHDICGFLTLTRNSQLDVDFVVFFSWGGEGLFF